MPDSYCLAGFTGDKCHMNCSLPQQTTMLEKSDTKQSQADMFIHLQTSNISTRLSMTKPGEDELVGGRVNTISPYRSDRPQKYDSSRETLRNLFMFSSRLNPKAISPTTVLEHH